MFIQFSRKQLIILQILFWLIVCTLSFYPIDWHRPAITAHGHGIESHSGKDFRHHGHGSLNILLFITQNLTIIGVFYFNYFTLIPRYFSQRKFKLYMAIVGVLVFIVAIIPLLFDLFSHHFHFHVSPRNFHQAMISMLAVSLAIILPLAFKISRDHAEAEREKTKAELSFLRSQINHHFLFNSLNNIYALSIQGNKHTPEAIYSLSSIMRHMATATATSKIALQQEINFIHHYIEIQKLRLSANTKLNYEIKGEVNNKLIGPMLLIPFIENCFKHGVSTSAPSNIDIQLNIQETSLELTTKNNIIPNINNTEIQSGVGLNNVYKRLNFEYANHYIMTNETKDGQYFSYLKIDFI